jgi:integral membrane sensor domain MASE1
MDCTGREFSVVKELVRSLSPTNLAFLASLTVIYFVVGRLGTRIAFVHPYVTPIWISAAFAFAACMLFGYRVWPAVFVGSFLAHVSSSGLEAASFGVPIAATLECVLGSYLVNKFAHGVKAFDSAKDVFLFVLFACICAPSFSATLGIVVMYFSGRTNLGFMWVTWWLAHSIGILLVTPFLVLLIRPSHHRFDLREFGELTILVLGLIFVCLLVFGPLSLSLNKDYVVQAWLCVPFLIWAGFRFCPLEAAGTTLILFGSAIWGTLHGYGSFVSKNLTTSLILLDTFVGVIGTMTLVVAGMVVERRRIEGELLGTQSLLQDAVERKDRDLVVTVQTLEVEVTGHAQTKRALRESYERLSRIAPNAKLEEKNTGNLN